MTIEKIILGGGCFWCVESVFLQVRGVEAVVSGYMGGHEENPSYQSVCTGMSGHAEVVAINYDSEQISLRELLMIFFALHDPTSLNRQGNDVGTQYRSVIFYADDAEKQLAEEVIADVHQQGVYQSEIVTTLEPLARFYPAEEYHQNYFAKNPSNAYCQFSILPKREKLMANFSEYVKA